MRCIGDRGMEDDAHEWGTLLAELVVLGRQHESNQRKINTLRNAGAPPVAAQPLVHAQKVLVLQMRKLRKEMRNFSKIAG
jgi:hypothetical protein